MFLIMIPVIPTQIKEWTNAGIRLFLIPALIAYLNYKDSAGILLLLIFLCAILIISNIYMSKILR